MVMLCNSWDVITALFSPDDVGTSSGVASIRTESVAAPTWRTIPARVRLSPCARTMSACSHDLKPAAVAVTVYVPGGTAAKVKYPSLLDAVSRVAPEAWFFSVTDAFGTVAPLGSPTVPESSP